MNFAQASSVLAVMPVTAEIQRIAYKRQMSRERRYFLHAGEQEPGAVRWRDRIADGARPAP